MTPSDERPFRALPAVAKLNRLAETMTQIALGARLQCAQPTMSAVLAGKARLGDLRRGIALREFGIDLADWLTPEELGRSPSDDANSASHLETPQAARTSSIPPSRQPLDAAASEGCPAPGEAA